MFSWEWEDFEEIVKKSRPVVEDAGPLSTPVQHFTIQRDKSLQLKMLTRAPAGATDRAVSYRLRDPEHVFFHLEMSIAFVTLIAILLKLSWDHLTQE